MSYRKIIYLALVFSCSELFAFSLQDAVNTTLSTNKNIKITKEDLTYLRGIKLSNEEVFDPIATASISTKNENVQNSVLIDPKTETNIKVHTANVGFQKYFTSGIQLDSGFTYNYYDVERNPKNSDESIYLTLAYPLLKFNTKRIVTGNLELSNMDIRIGKLNYQQEVSNNVLDTMRAYWNYVRLYKIYELDQLSLQRSTKFYKVIEILTNADEKPKSDLKRPSVDVINKNISLIASQKDLTNAQNDLCVVMDVSREQCTKLIKPSDSFEEVSVETSTILSSNTIYHQELDENRFDLKVLDLELEKSQLSLDISKDDLNHELDLKLDLVGSSQNINTNLSIPVLASNDRKGNTAKLSLNYKLNLNNNYKKGQYISSLSRYKQKRLAVEKTKKDAHFELEKDITKIKSTISQCTQIQKSVEVYNEILQDELDKYQLGMATILDIVQTEDSFISTKLSLINCLYTFSLDSIKLKRDTQTLLTINGDKFVVNY